MLLFFSKIAKNLLTKRGGVQLSDLSVDKLSQVIQNVFKLT